MIQVTGRKIAAWLSIVACFGFLGQAPAIATQAAEKTPDSGEVADAALDAATLQEIERLRDEIATLLGSVPEAFRPRVFDLLVTEASQNEVPAASSSTSQASQNEVPATSSSTPQAAPNEVPATSSSTSQASQNEVPATSSSTPQASQNEVPATSSSTSQASPNEVPATSSSTSQASPNEVPATSSTADQADPQDSPYKVRSKRPRCNSLDLLDENGDGKVSAVDRYWRHLYVWVDRNGDGQRQDKEVESTYDAGVREIQSDLQLFYRKKGSLGEMRHRDTLLLDLAGDGFGERGRPDDGVLMIDADALSRGEGPKVFADTGQAVEGIAPFSAGWTFRLADGQELAINCPASR